jgi:(p)ppGpp synthase/HD superfamily hydrolase
MTNKQPHKSRVSAARNRRSHRRTTAPTAKSALLQKAILIALEAHAGQRQRNGQAYVLHPLRVMARVQTEDEQVVAVLHDAVEDTPWTFEMLTEQGFPPHIIAALDCVTKREGEKYSDFVRRNASNPIAFRVKLADLEDNMDLRRLPALTPKDKRRMTKYLTAYRWLVQQEARPSGAHRRTRT